VAAGFLIFTVDARPVCRVPQPRLLCAEDANSQVVVIAKLDSIREVVRDGSVEGHFYSFAARTRLHGKIDSAFQVWEEHSSGRSSFAWTKGVDYLLFASYSSRDRAWVIDGCGNSGPVDLSEPTLPIDRSVKPGKDGIVSGMASTEAWTTGVPDVTITAVGRGKTFTARTNPAGRFEMLLPAGRYRMEASLSGWSFAPTLLSYENPADLVLTRRGCAQVHFSGSQKNK
jgi:hypothetical protein